MARLTDTGPRCTERVPERLCGGLKGTDRPVCRRSADHSGKHRAQRRLRGVGNTIWEWKTKPEAGCYRCSLGDPCSGNHETAAQVFDQPEIVVVRKEFAPKESVKHTCKCKGMLHRCKRYRGLWRQ